MVIFLNIWPFLIPDPSPDLQLEDFMAVMIRVILASFDLLTTLDLRVPTFRVNVELLNYYHGQGPTDPRFSNSSWPLTSPRFSNFDWFWSGPTFQNSPCRPGFSKIYLVLVRVGPRFLKILRSLIMGILEENLTSRTALVMIHKLSKSNWPIFTKNHRKSPLTIF